MVSRKAITTAFEIIIADRTMKTITVFCLSKRVPLMKTCRVRVTRMKRSPDEYRVTLGRMNYAEREFMKRETVAKRSPKLMATWFPKKKAK